MAPRYVPLAPTVSTHHRGSYSITQQPIETRRTKCRRSSLHGRVIFAGVKKRVGIRSRGEILRGDRISLTAGGGIPNVVSTYFALLM